MDDTSSTAVPQTDPSAVPVISPEGVAMSIPRTNLSQALKENFQSATYVTSPEGEQMVIPTQNVGAAIQHNGFRVGKPAVQAAAAQAPGALSSFGRGAALEAGSQLGLSGAHPVWDAVKNFFSASPGETATGAAIGLPPPLVKMVHGAYNASADQFSKAKQSFQQGNYLPAIIHGAAGALPVVGPMAEMGGEALGDAVTGPTGQFLSPSQIDPEQAGHAIVKAAAPLAMLAGGTPEGEAAADTAISKVAGGVEQGATALANRATTTAKSGADAFNATFRPEALDAGQSITKAAKPRSSVTNWQTAIQTALPDARRAADGAGIQVSSLDDALKATTQAKKDIWAEYQSHLGPNAQVTVDGNKVADAMESAITPRFAVQNPTAADNIQAIASTYRRPMTLGEVEDYLQDANNQLKNIYARDKINQRAAAQNPATGSMLNEAGALRGLVNDTLSNMTGGDIQGLKQRYGNLSTLEDVLSRRVNVADRAAPNSLIEQMGTMRSAGKIAKGVFTLSPGDVLEGATNLAAARAARKANSSDFLTQQAFDKTMPSPAAQPYSPPPAPPIPTFLQNLINGVAKRNLPPGQYQVPPTPVAGYLPESASTGMHSVPTTIEGRSPIPAFLQKALPPQRQIQLGPGNGKRVVNR